MTEIKYHIGVNEFNGSENDIQERHSLQVTTTSKALPQIIDGIIREDSPLGEQLRKLIKDGGYSITFNIDINVKQMPKSKLKRLRRKHYKISSGKTLAKEES